MTNHDGRGARLAGHLKSSLPVLVVLLVACVGPTDMPTTSTEDSRADKDRVIPGTTIATTPDTTLPESFEWPTVVAGDFMHQPNGPVGGVRTSDLTAPCHPCLLTVLADGRVLKIGGGGTAETRDPVTGAWAPVGSANGDSYSLNMEGTDLPTAVLVDDGRVLISGMATHGKSSLEIFEPQTGSFRLLSNLPGVTGSGEEDVIVPPGSDAIKLSDGRVLVAWSQSGGLIFDPVDDSATLSGSRRPHRAPDAGIALADGRTLLVRGSNLSIYDPATDRFRGVGETYQVTSHPDARLSLAALPDGRVLMTGGALLDENGGEPHALADAALFDPASETVTSVGPMLHPRAGHSTVTLPEGRVVIIGGGAGDRVEVFNPSTESFQAAPALSRSRDDASAVVLQDGNILVVGGVDQWHRFYAVDPTTPLTAEIYHPDGTVSTPSQGSLSGVTFGFETDDLPQYPPGSGWAHARVVIPPGGLEGATRGELRSGFEDFGVVGVDFYAEVTAPPDLPRDEFHLILDDCEQGCEINQRLIRLADLRGPLMSVHLHIQYQGEIPAEAGDITLTIEAGGGG